MDRKKIEEAIRIAEYIISSPLKEHGGFHSQTIRMAKTALFVLQAVKEERLVEVETLEKAVEHRTQILHDLLKDTCDDDTEIRKIARKHLTKYEVEGDSYGVPTIVDIVGLLAGKIGKETGR